MKNIKQKLYEHYYCGKPASSFFYYCGLCVCCPVRGSGLNHAPLAILWAVVDTEASNERRSKAIEPNVLI